MYIPYYTHQGGMLGVSYPVLLHQGGMLGVLYLVNSQLGRHAGCVILCSLEERGTTRRVLSSLLCEKRDNEARSILLSLGEMGITRRVLSLFFTPVSLLGTPAVRPQFLTFSQL